MYNVLYVDDEPALLEIGKLFLERSHQFHVDTVSSAHEALQILKSTSYDAIVSDYQMPGMDGIALLKAIRAEFPELPFIIFTGKGREEVVIEAFNSGADFYLQKGGTPTPQFLELGHKITAAVCRRQAEKALKASEQRYRNIIEDQTEFICRFRPDGIHVFVNDAYCRYFNKAREEIIGNNFRPELFPEDRKHLREMFASLTPENPVGFIRQRVIFPDGSIRWQRWVDRAIYDESGTLVEYQSVGRDITDIKTAELALAESEEKYRTVFENTGTATVVVEENGIISLANKEFVRLSGFSKDDIEAKKSWTEFVVNEDLERMLAQHRLRRQNPEKALTKYEFRFVTKSRNIHTISLSIDVIPGTKKSIASLLDITEKKHSEEELRIKNVELHAAYEQIAATEQELRHNYNELDKKGEN